MAATSEETIALLHGCRRSRRSADDDLAARRRGHRAAALRGRRGRVPRGRPERHLLHRAFRPRPGGPRAHRRPLDHPRHVRARARSSASWRSSTTERRSATVESLEETEVIAILAGDMRRMLREHPDIAVKLLAALEPPAAGDQRAAHPAVVPDRAEPGGGGAGRAGGRRARPRARASSDVLITATQSRSRPARGFLAGVGEPLSGRARAGRDHHPGTRAADRPRPRRPGAAMSTDGRSRLKDFSAGGRGRRRRPGRGDRAGQAGRRRAPGARTAQGTPDGDETPEQAARARSPRRRGSPAS